MWLLLLVFGSFLVVPRILDFGNHAVHHGAGVKQSSSWVYNFPSQPSGARYVCPVLLQAATVCVPMKLT